jgi:tetratricopeptide (TPR) repeat protein
MGSNDGVGRHHRDDETGRDSDNSKPQTERETYVPHVFEPRTPFIVSDEDLPGWWRHTVVDLQKTDSISTAASEGHDTELQSSRDTRILTSDTCDSEYDKSGPEGGDVHLVPKASLGNYERLSDETIAKLLSTARDLIRAGKTEPALGHYERLTQGNAALQDVISDLEIARNSLDQSSPILLKTLGDAYIKTDRIEQALELYREASEYIKN